MEDLTRKLRMTQLARDIDIFDQTTLPEEEDVPDIRATMRHIKSLVRRELHGDAKVKVFGSSRVGTDLPTSDVDIAVNHDIIKAFEEPYRVAEKRFGELRATGGTPLADGIQFAMDNLEYRDEDNKIIFVVTDGWPNHGHVEVINRQIRLCQERGWHIIGVGVGYEARYVLNLFPDAVQADTVSEIPALLVRKLSELMTGGTIKRRRAS